MHAYIHTYIHVNIQTYYTHTASSVHEKASTCPNTNASTQNSLSKQARRTLVCMYVCMHMWYNVCIMCVCMRR